LFAAENYYSHEKIKNIMALRDLYFLILNLSKVSYYETDNNRSLNVNKKYRRNGIKKLNIAKPTGNLYLRNEKDKVIVNITDVKGSTIKKNQIGFRMLSTFHFRK